MGILSRFITVVRSNINAMLNRAEDPTKMLDQTLIDMDAAYRKAKDQVARSVADEKRLQKSFADQKNEAAKWSERAVKAVEKGDDDLAKEALMRKGEHTRMSLQFEHELGAHQENVANLKNSLHELESRIAEIKRKKNLLVSKQKRAQAQDQIYKTMEGIQDTGAVDTINRMEEKIEEMSHLADARMELSEEFSGDALEKKFAELGPGEDVDAELLELKQQLKLEDKSGKS
ncbi:MAG: PspA/IM30 family protein [SAR324 cluster bacterium]|nr:PspA/IM30 family protein [SAR324 cluster bacterium]MCZ6557111.1 PspA/IM30 family protein [SAR324 cluster bacterium]MCZ6842965.1 PspA/IM30 family protein [SAR324 cluster bacterium]